MEDCKPDDDQFLGAINSHSQTRWTETVLLNGHPIQFKLDTGAEVTAVSEATYAHIGYLYCIVGAIQTRHHGAIDA